jgi:hypothetical protein
MFTHFAPSIDHQGNRSSTSMLFTECSHGSGHRITGERLPATDKPKREKIAKLE